MGLREEPFLIRSGLLVLINKLPDRINKKDVKSFLDWEKEFVASRDTFINDHLGTDTHKSILKSGGDIELSPADKKEDISAAFQSLTILVRHLSREIMDCFRGGAEYYDLPFEVRRLRELAKTNAKGRGSAAIIAAYLAKQQIEAGK